VNIEIVGMRLINYLLENKRVELMIKDKDDDDQKSFNKNMLSVIIMKL